MANLIIENVGPAETGSRDRDERGDANRRRRLRRRRVASILAGHRSGSAAFPPRTRFTVAFAAVRIALALGVLVGLAIPQRRPVDRFVRHRGRRAAGTRLTGRSLELPVTLRGRRRRNSSTSSTSARSRPAEPPRRGGGPLGRAAPLPCQGRS
jgi:hypothetical protein